MSQLHRFALKSSLLLILCCGLSIIAQADTITIQAMQTGWYRSDGLNNGVPSVGLNSYFVGRTFSREVYRNYFVFNLTYITGVTSAELRIYNINGSSVLDHDPSENYTIYNVATPALDLGGANSVAVYDDLGSGTIYGSIDVPYSFEANYVVLNLNAAAIQAIQQNGGLFAIGGAITTLDRSFGPEALFAGGMADVTLTVQGQHVPVPEPATLLLLGTGLLGAATRLRRKRRDSKHTHPSN